MFRTTNLLFLTRKIRAFFSVSNYMKTFQSHQVTRHHGYFRVDQYSHFDKDPKAIQSFIQQQKQLYQKESSKWKHITDEYYQISSSRRDTRLSSVPERYDDYQYFTKTTWKGQREYSTVYRRKSEQNEELVLDIMTYPFISKYYETVQLLSTSFSPSHKLIAFAIDLKNNEKSVYYIAKTQGKRQVVKIGESSRSKRLQDAHDLVFLSQNRIFYIKSQNHRPSKLFSMDLSTGESQLIFSQQNQQFYLGLRMSKDRLYLLLSGVSKTNSKIWILDTGGNNKIVKVWEGPGKIYINHIEGNFVVWMCNEVSSIKLIKDEVVKQLLKDRDNIELSKVTGEVLYTSAEEERVQDIDLIKNSIILYGYKVTNPFLKVINFTKDQKKELIVNCIEAILPFNYGTIAPCTNESYQTDQILFSVSTPFVYEEIYSYSISKNKYQVVQKYQHTGPAIRTKKFQVEVLEVPATDMNKIPLTIIGPTKKRSQKLLLNFYGCYGLPTRIPYDNVTIAALEKGWTVCHAHVRGGNEKGQKWHSQSQGDNRLRTWMDIEQCVGFLIKEQYTHPSLLFLSSSSAGAIGLWNLIARKPYLYKGAIFKVPFLDVLSSLLDQSQPLSNTDYQQFGNPLINYRSYQQIAAISPYETISPKSYPVIHITSGQNDYRTPISQIAKFASRFRDQALLNQKVEEIGVKGLTIDISSSGSHLGEASITTQNYRACDQFGYMDYVINHISKDCKLITE